MKGQRGLQSHLKSSDVQPRRQGRVLGKKKQTGDEEREETLEN